MFFSSHRWPLPPPLTPPLCPHPLCSFAHKPSMTPSVITAGHNFRDNLETIYLTWSGRMETFCRLFFKTTNMDYFFERMITFSFLNMCPSAFKQRLNTNNSAVASIASCKQPPWVMLTKLLGYSFKKKKKESWESSPGSHSNKTTGKRHFIHLWPLQISWREKHPSRGKFLSRAPGNTNLLITHDLAAKRELSISMGPPREFPPFLQHH